LPAILAGVLVVAAGAQILLPHSVELPPGRAAGRVVAAYLAPAVDRIAVPGVILAQPLFAPRRADAGAPGGIEPALGGAVVAGTVSVRGRSFAVVRRADGQIGNLPIGGRIAGWRLVALSAQGAAFVKEGKRIEVAYGAVAAVAPQRDEEEEEAEE
jgi:hypothetical protein